MSEAMCEREMAIYESTPKNNGRALYRTLLFVRRRIKKLAVKHYLFDGLGYDVFCSRFNMIEARLATLIDRTL